MNRVRGYNVYTACSDSRCMCRVFSLWSVDLDDIIMSPKNTNFSLNDYNTQSNGFAHPKFREQVIAGSNRITIGSAACWFFRLGGSNPNTVF